jgi:hypothetical protein
MLAVPLATFTLVPKGGRGRCAPRYASRVSLLRAALRSLGTHAQGRNARTKPANPSAAKPITRTAPANAGVACSDRKFARSSEEGHFARSSEEGHFGSARKIARHFARSSEDRKIATRLRRPTSRRNFAMNHTMRRAFVQPGACESHDVVRFPGVRFPQVADPAHRSIQPELPG